MAWHVNTSLYWLRGYFILPVIDVLPWLLKWDRGSLSWVVYLSRCLRRRASYFMPGIINISAYVRVCFGACIRVRACCIAGAAWLDTSSNAVKYLRRESTSILLTLSSKNLYLTFWNANKSPRTRHRTDSIYPRKSNSPREEYGTSCSVINVNEKRLAN